MNQHPQPQAERPSFLTILPMAACYQLAKQRKADEWATAALGTKIIHTYFGDEYFVNIPERPPSDKWGDRKHCDFVTQYLYQDGHRVLRLSDPFIFWEWKRECAEPKEIATCEKQIENALTKGIAHGKEGFGVSIIGGMIRIYKKWATGPIICLTGPGPAITDSYSDITFPLDAQALDAIFRDMRVAMG